MKVIWSPLALEKLEVAAEYIAQDKPAAAYNWVNDVFDQVDLLVDQPEMGRAVPELIGTNYRELIFGSYRIIYKVGSQVDILTIRNSRQLLSIADVED